MTTKLTLKLDKDIIKQAKVYAYEKQQSLSSLVEIYFRFLLEQEASGENEISPTVRELSGIIQLNDEFDFEKDYTNYLL
ncbi:MAG: hypothetical protein GY797_13715, partial [Deltaproteobacteria bacterium]|nr:hypothetical protein [Deltaproteobacteria bacterium]